MPPKPNGDRLKKAELELKKLRAAQAAETAKKKEPARKGPVPAVKYQDNTAQTSFRTAAGDNMYVNPINGPIAGSHKAINK